MKSKLDLRSRLFISHLLVIGVTLLVLGLAGRATSLRLFAIQLDQLEGVGYRIRFARSQLVRGFDLVWNRTTIWSAGIGATAAGAFSYWAARRITKPLEQMEDITQRFAAGETDVRMVSSEIPELNQLSTSFNRMAANIQGIEQRRRELVGDLTHELRTPLTVMRGYLEELAEQKIEPSEDLYRRLIRETKRLERLVNETQELSKAEAGHLPIDLHPIDVRGLLQAIAARFADQIFNNDPQLSVDCPPDLPLVLADSDRIEQVLVNLTSNALRHTPTGSIVLWAQEDSNQPFVWLGVTDTGEGITPEDLPNVFERFWRGDRARSRQAEGRSSGAGIGLAISRRLVELQGGEITVESTPGQGSTFRFSLPCA